MKQHKNQEWVRELQERVDTGDIYFQEILPERTNEEILGIIENLQHQRKQYLDLEKDTAQIDKDILCVESYLELRHIYDDIDRVKRGEPAEDANNIKVIK